MALYYIDLEIKKVISANSGHEDSIIIKSNGEVIVNKEKLSIVYSNDVTKFKDELETIYVCIEELIVNIVDYAYKDREGNNKILIKLVIDKNLDKLSISFIDSGKEFDPTKLADPNILASVDNRKVGGLGVYITKQKMDVMEYKYENGKNCLTITKYL